MFCRYLIALIPIASLLCLTACGEVEDTRPGQPVKTRQQAFKNLIRTFEPMGTMLKEKRYDADKFSALAAEFHAQRNAPWSHFGSDTQYPPSKSKTEVWSQAEAFDKARNEFIAATDELMSAAQTRDKARINDAYKTVYDTCQRCHKTFRER